MSKEAGDFAEVAALADRVRLAIKRALREQNSERVVVALNRSDARALLDLTKDLLREEVKP